MTDEDFEEMYQDMLEEAYEEELYENKLRTDYEFFLSQQDIELFQELYWELKRQHEAYGWEFDIGELV